MHMPSEKVREVQIHVPSQKKSEVIVGDRVTGHALLQFGPCDVANSGLWWAIQAF
jgi:hypothetical protein